MEWKLEAFEMWIWKRMVKINWLDKVTNEEVSGEWRQTNTELYLAKNIDGLAMFWETTDFYMALLKAEWEVNQQ